MRKISYGRGRCDCSVRNSAHAWFGPRLVGGGNGYPKAHEDKVNFRWFGWAARKLFEKSSTCSNTCSEWFWALALQYPRTGRFEMHQRGCERARGVGEMNHVATLKPSKSPHGREKWHQMPIWLKVYLCHEGVLLVTS